MIGAVSFYLLLSVVVCVCIPFHQLALASLIVLGESPVQSCDGKVNREQVARAARPEG
jgi:hypothetical protein